MSPSTATRFALLYTFSITTGMAQGYEALPEPPELSKQSTTIHSQNNPNETRAEKKETQAEVTTTRRGKETVEEYRIRGKLTQIRVIPDGGKPYYLSDPADMSRYVPQDQHNSDVRAPQWKVLNF